MTVSDRSSNSPPHATAAEPVPPSATPEERVRALERERDELTRALTAARAAQASSEAVLRSREELFAIVVHDLRNPLGTIVMGATALLQGEPSPDPKEQRVRTVAERIHRQAERMTRQLGNLSDFTELQAGRFEIARARHAPAQLLASANELIAPIARERGVGFAFHPAAALPALDCDGERVVQTLANLATAAIKATGRGGTVEIGAQGTPCVFYVRDQIAREASAKLQTDLSMTLAHGIVDAHGGRLWSERDATAGTTTYFSVAPDNAKN